MLKKILTIYFFINFCLLIPFNQVFTEEKKQVTSENPQDKKTQTYLYLYKEKDPFRAIVYSAIPGAGNLYAENSSNFLITWLIIGGSYAIYSALPFQTQEQRDYRNSIFLAGLVSGWIYSIVTSWIDTVKYNERIRKEIRTGKIFNIGFYKGEFILNASCRF